MKGEYNGVCNLTACTSGKPATWYNHGSQAYYCRSCAMRLNNDPFNKRDAERLFGHDLCTEKIVIEYRANLEMDIDTPIFEKSKSKYHK